MYNQFCKRFARYEFVGFLFVTAGSFLMHFIYELTGFHPLAALLGAANESVWEHTKILLLPYLVYALFELLVLRPAFVRFFVAKTAGLLFITTIVIVFFYTYSGILGYHVTWVDIASAIVYAALAHLLSYRLYCGDADIERYFLPALLVFALLLVAFIRFTFHPPRLNLFYDQSGGFYGPKPAGP